MLAKIYKLIVVIKKFQDYIIIYRVFGQIKIVFLFRDFKLKSLIIKVEQNQNHYDMDYIFIFLHPIIKSAKITPWTKLIIV